MPDNIQRSGVEFVALGMDKVLRDLGALAAKMMVIDREVSAATNKLNVFGTALPAGSARQAAAVNTLAVSIQRATAEAINANNSLHDLRDAQRSLAQSTAKTTKETEQSTKAEKQHSVEIQKLLDVLKSGESKVNSFGKSIGGIGAFLASLGSKISSLGGPFSALGGFIAKLASGTGSVATAVGSVLPLFAKLASVVTALGPVILIVVAAFKALKAIISVITGAFGLLVKGVTGVLGFLKDAAKKILDFGKSVLSAINPLKNLKSWLDKVFQIAGGFTLATTFLRIAQSLREVVREAGNAASQFQTLEIRLQGLIARQMRVKDVTLGVEESYRLAGSQAKEYLQWVKELAINSPFDTSLISETFTLAQAFQFTSTESQVLTEAILNMSAGMGLSNEQMSRMIVNFGQMKLQGKITNREMRDLAVGSFVPVNDILKKMAENMGIAKENFQEFIQEASRGGVATDQFFKAFVEVANKDFAGAAERMSRTWQGLTSRTRDFIETIIGVEALGPVLGKLTNVLNEALDSLLTPKSILEFQRLGNVLSQSFDIFWQALTQKLIPAFQEFWQALGFATPSVKGFAQAIVNLVVRFDYLADRISGFLTGTGKDMATTFQGWAANAKVWGGNLIIEFANGMATAIHYVLDILLDLGEMIAGWLSPGSPPKILPQIDKWGAQAFTEYIKGFGNADFDVFNSLAGKFASFFQSIPGGVGKDNRGLIPLILGTRQAIAESLNMVRSAGRITTEAVNNVLKAAKGATKEFGGYIKAMFEAGAAADLLARAQKNLDRVEEENTKRVKAAQDQLNASKEYYGNILDELNKKLRRNQEVTDDAIRMEEIEIALATQRLTQNERQELEAERRDLMIKNTIRGVEDERDAVVGAQEDAVAAAEARQEAEVGTAQARVDTAQATKDAADAELQYYENLIDVQIEQNRLIQQQLQLLESLKKKAGGAAAAVAEGLGFGGFAPAERKKQTRADRRDRGIGRGEASPFSFTELFKNAQEGLASFEETIGKIAAPFEGIFGPEGKLSKVITQFGDIFDLVFGTDGRIFDIIVNKFTNWITGKWDNLGLWLGGKIREILGNIWTLFMNYWNSDGLIAIVYLKFEAWINQKFAELGLYLGQKAQEAWIAVKGWYDSYIGDGALLRLAVDAFMTFSMNAWTTFNDWLNGGAGLIPMLWGLVRDKYDEFLKSDGLIPTILNGFYTFSETFWTNLKTNIAEEGGIIPGMLKTINDTFNTYFNTTDGLVWIKVRDVVAAVFDFFDNLRANLVADGAGGIIEKMMSGAWEIFKKYLDKIATKVQKVIDKILKLFGFMEDESVGNSIIPDMLSAMESAFSGSFDNILGLTKAFTSDILTELGDMQTAGKDMGPEFDFAKFEDARNFTNNMLHDLEALVSSSLAEPIRMKGLELEHFGIDPGTMNPADLRVGERESAQIADFMTQIVSNLKIASDNLGITMDELVPRDSAFAAMLNPIATGATTNVTNNNISVNANYANTQTEAGVYMDVAAALLAVV